MKYNFPVIKHVDDIMPVIEGNEEFGCFDRGGVLIANYVVRFENTFPEINSVDDAIRRECRGITFDLETGDIIRRPFHKFFNINETPETQENLVNISKPHVILEKLDGSMFSPFMRVGSEVIEWGTKMGVTEVSEPARRFVAAHPNYNKLALECLKNGLSPMFEWCSRSLRIVIDHPQDQLILTAVRDMVTGAYADYDDLTRLGKKFDVPVVGVFDTVSDMSDFIKHTRALNDSEGYIMRFDNGHMVKFKSEWYCEIHTIKSRINSVKETTRLILRSEIDDVYPFLSDEEVENLHRYEGELEAALMQNYEKVSNEIKALVQKHGTKKDFALSEDKDKLDGFHRGMVFEFWERPITFSDYMKKVNNIFASDELSNRRFREYKELVFPEVNFYEQQDY